MKRREFIQHAIVAGSGTAILASTPVGRAQWTIGCFNRPWTKWPFDQTLKSIRAAGFTTVGLLTRTAEEPFIAADATPEYLQMLKTRIAKSDLTANMATLRSRHDIPLEDSIRDARKQIDNARFLSLKYVLSMGVDKPDEFNHYCRVMSNVAGYAHERGIRLAMKPHGGISGSSEEILGVIKEVRHSNFSIWYDAGNIIYYTGKDPVAELEPIARHVSGFCAKDCGEPKGEVMIQFGAGKVDFATVFKKLKSAAFDGPVMIECCKVGATSEETSLNARANRVFLERVVGSI